MKGVTDAAFAVIASTALLASVACGGSGNDDARPASSTSPAATTPLFVPRCDDGDPTRQRHGATCLCCHTDDFGVAGSIDPNGSRVDRIVVTDANGEVARMAPNSFGNFFRHFAMTAPFRAVAIAADGRSIAMQGSAPSADCNECHSTNGTVPPIHGP